MPFPLPNDPIGAAWLIRRHGCDPLGRLPVVSQIGGRRATETTDGFRLETYTEAMRPDGHEAAHLQFHLRHEVPHLEFMSRLFARMGPDAVQAWVDAEPTGGYARRAAFLYEWLTGNALRPPERLGGNYVAAVDDAKIFASSPDQIVKVQRWRVDDNLPGTRHFCPMLVKNPEVLRAADLDIPKLFADLAAEFGEDLLMRAAAWMTLRESKASFAIEGEADRANRIQRFADVMARRTGEGELPLTDASLAELQRDILGERTTLAAYGLRQSPVFVGEMVRHQEVVHFVAPPAQDLVAMLEGLRVFLERTRGQSPAMRAAAAAFGFVYIHPMADGNGRVHRFLINDVLRRDGVVPAPVILPVSAAITEDAGERRGYDRVLDRVSRPLMEAVRDSVSFAAQPAKYPDGVVSNLVFAGDELARPLWRYPDLGPHVTYMSNVIHRTLHEQMREESRYLRSHGRAREALKEIVEMPDHQADRVLRSIEQNEKRLSNVLAKEIPLLREGTIWSEIVQAVDQAFGETPADREVTDRYRAKRPAGR